MSMYEAIKNQGSQFGFEPVIENSGQWWKFGKFVVAGMGGSHLAADLLKIWKPELDLLIHNDYGLPALSDEEFRSRLVILSSYSGNTEEVLDAYLEAKEKGCSLGAISVGGKLLERARKDGTPYIQLPDTGIQPRSALGFSFKALLKMMGAEEEALKEVSALAHSLDPAAAEEEGKALAHRLRGFVPIIYSSAKNLPIAYNWKIKFNETGKIPAFCNVLPELNHNEMTGFDAAGKTKKLSEHFYFIFLRDGSDHPRNLKRMEILERLYRDRGHRLEVRALEGKNIFTKIFSSLVLADWAAFYTAEGYGVESEQVPMVEEFKKLVA